MQVTLDTPADSLIFESGGGRPILHAALAAGISVPYECLSGSCGSCKARLHSGRVEHLWTKAPAWSLLGRDEVLLCQCAAAEPCTFVLKSGLGKNTLANRPRDFAGTLSGWRQVTDDVVTFSVELQSSLTFEAGQFVALQLPGVPGLRCYSMTNPPSSERRLDLLVRRKACGAASTWLFERDRSGTPVTGFGAVGSATLDPESGYDLLCIAGGSGIAGMLSILRLATDRGYFAQRRAELYFGLRRSQDAFLLDELDAMVRRAGSALRITVAFSEEPARAEHSTQYPRLAFETGLVHEVAARLCSMPLKRQQGQPGVMAYVAGPPAAVNAALRVLLQLRLGPSAIRYDKFG